MGSLQGHSRSRRALYSSLRVSRGWPHRGYTCRRRRADGRGICCALAAACYGLRSVRQGTSDRLMFFFAFTVFSQLSFRGAIYFGISTCTRHAQISVSQVVYSAPDVCLRYHLFRSAIPYLPFRSLLLSPNRPPNQFITSDEVSLIEPSSFKRPGSTKQHRRRPLHCILKVHRPFLVQHRCHVIKLRGIVIGHVRLGYTKRVSVHFFFIVTFLPILFYSDYCTRAIGEQVWTLVGLRESVNHPYRFQCLC